MSINRSEITVYTCAVGGYDFILPPVVNDPLLRFICFTDKPGKRVRGWNVRPIQSPPEITNPTLINRYHKFFPHRLGFRTKWSVYIDGNMRVVGPVSELVEEVRKADAVMACLHHPWRNKVEEEIAACIRTGKISHDEATVAYQRLQQYVAEGMPSAEQLLENKVIIREHSKPAVQEAMETWWEELNRSVSRDQLALPYVLWNHGIRVCIIPSSSWLDREYFHRYGHRKHGFGSIRQYLVLRKDELGFRQLYAGVKLTKWFFLLPSRLRLMSKGRLTR